MLRYFTIYLLFGFLLAELIMRTDKRNSGRQSVGMYLYLVFLWPLMMIIAWFVDKSER